ncbi:MAG: Protein serine/threonine phosphatase, partial [Candidatus Uhrbacteria bacterium GW2011_GWE2_45_35]
AAGDTMSRAVMAMLYEHSHEIFGDSLDEVMERFEEVVQKIVAKAHIYSNQITPEGQARAVATFLAAKIVERPEGFWAIVKSIGDSSAFVWQADGRVVFLGAEKGLPEDSLLQKYVDEGRITQLESELISEAPTRANFAAELVFNGLATENEVLEVYDLSSEEISQKKRLFKNAAFLTPRQKQQLHLLKLFQIFNRNPQERALLTQAVGLPGVNFSHTVLVKLSPGDRLVLTSDGLSDNLTKAEIRQILSSAGSLQEGLKNLRAAASDRSQEIENLLSKEDDITLNGLMVVPGARKARGSRLSQEQTRRLSGRRRFQETTRIQNISEALGKALDLAEEDPEVAVLEEKIKEEERLRQVSKAAGDFVSNIGNYFDQRAVVLKIAKMARVGSGDAYENWDDYISKLKRDLQLLRLKKENQEKIA